MHAPMDEDVRSTFPLRLVSMGSPQGIQEHVRVANQHMLYGLYRSILEP
ncbi:hypothetical protein Gotri_005906 [Gossypium trilobum]|uniref:Uncharacterized protein n=1 Tax=Gossypium trilobum TaxID=34281 RepID=A0A7J9EY55_9ROSI|nr:hypothetical protein [Gossypium trilobum]